MEAASLAQVAGRADLVDPDEQDVTVAVDPDLLHMLDMAARLALAPQLVPGAAPGRSPRRSRLGPSTSAGPPPPRGSRWLRPPTPRRPGRSACGRTRPRPPTRGRPGALRRSPRPCIACRTGPRTWTGGPGRG